MPTLLIELATSKVHKLIESRFEKPTTMNANCSKYDASLNNAADAIFSDNRDLLKEYLLQLEADERVETHLMQAWASDSLQESEAAIQTAVELDPNNEVAEAGLKWFDGIRALAASQLELKRLAEEEARRKAEEEARLQAEAEARAKAEEEARLQAEAEARAKAEEEARLQAEAEAQAKAEEEARIKAEESQREAELAQQVELERRAELERHAELERQAEIRRKAEIERNNQAEAERLAQLASPDVVSELIGGDQSGQDETPDKIELELQTGFVELAEEIQNDVQTPSALDSTEVPSAGKQKILVVDDSPTIRKLITLTLGGEGYEVITAEDGVNALNVLAETMPDMILTDINMPKLNGYKLCNFVKKHERTKSIPVVMLSGRDGVFDKMRGKMNGCDDFIAKPFESADLIAKVGEVLSASTSL